MADVDSEIKVDQATYADIFALEKRQKAFIILQIAKPEGSKVEKVVTKLAMTNEEVAAAVQAGSLTVNDKTVALTKKGDETDTWCAFRSAIATFSIAYGSCFVDFKTKEGRPTDKLVYVTWTPDGASFKDKMKYSSTKVMKKFSSTPLKYQASNVDDVTYAKITSVVRK